MKDVHVHTLLPYACMHLLLQTFLSACELLVFWGTPCHPYPFSLHQRSNFQTVKLRHPWSCMSHQQLGHTSICKYNRSAIGLQMSGQASL